MKLLAVFAAILLFSVDLPAQQVSAPAPPITPMPRRDPQALALLAQCVNVAGPTSTVVGIRDFSGTGAITYRWAGQDVPGSVIVYGTSLNQFRMDTTISGGVQSLVVDGPAGTLLPLNGQKVKLPYFSLMTAGSLTFPLLRVIAALNDPTTGLSYIGSVDWNTSQALKVHVALQLNPSLLIDNRLSGLGEFDLYVDPATFRILEVIENIWWSSDLSQTYSHEVIFSNYTLTGGLTVPFTITEKFGGQQTWSINLTSMTFNSGLSNSLFAL